MRHVNHFKQTPIAQAPDELVRAINHYTDWTATLNDPLPGAALNHYHNRAPEPHSADVITYHSEPERCTLFDSGPYPTVIAQYHPLLSQYADMTRVRNVINFELDFDLYTPRTRSDRIRIGYSPSITDSQGRWYDKGYGETVPILRRVSKLPRVDVDIIHGVPLTVCIYRKSECHILIDEVKTGAFHRSALEGLALGAVTISGISPDVEEILLSSSGAAVNPLFVASIDTLEQSLLGLIGSGVDALDYSRRYNRGWMREYWNPRDIAREYTDLYQSVMENRHADI